MDMIDEMTRIRREMTDSAERHDIGLARAAGHMSAIAGFALEYLRESDPEKFERLLKVAQNWR